LKKERGEKCWVFLVPFVRYYSAVYGNNAIARARLIATVSLR